MALLIMKNYSQPTPPLRSIADAGCPRRDSEACVTGREGDPQRLLSIAGDLLYDPICTHPARHAFKYSCREPNQRRRCAWASFGSIFNIRSASVRA